MSQVFSQRTDKPHAYRFGEFQNQLAFDPIEFSISKDGSTWYSVFDQEDIDGAYCYRAPDVQPANPTDNLRKVGLMDGSRLLTTSYSTRELKMEMLFNGLNEADAMLAYDALQRFLMSRNAYWICFANWPQRMYYVKAKMAAPVFSGERIWTCEITFTDLIGLSRSITTSQNYMDGAGWGNNMPMQKLNYTFNSSSFTVYNPGDVLIDPERRGHPFKLTMKGSSSGNMKITNRTTGNYIKRSGYVTTSSNGQQTHKSDFNGTWVLDGVRPTLDGKSDLMNCTPDVITLQPGANTFSVENFSGTVSFDFPIWWLS